MQVGCSVGLGEGSAASAESPSVKFQTVDEASTKPGRK